MKKYWEVSFYDYTSEEEVTHKFFTEDTYDISAFEWAEDAAYALADKGNYSLKEIKQWQFLDAGREK